MRWTDEEFLEFQKRRGIKTVDETKPAKTKYNNKKIWIDGFCFDSQQEAKYYLTLKLLMKAGVIKGFCRQAAFIVVEGDDQTRGTEYKADFIVFYSDNTWQIIDTKGFETEVFKIKHKAFKEKYPKLELKLIKEV